MSFRGSFVTEYIYCAQCLEKVRNVLLRREKALMGIQVPTWIEGSVDLLPIIAGKLGSTSPDGEVRELEAALEPLRDQLCHPLTVVAICEGGEGGEPHVIRIPATIAG